MLPVNVHQQLSPQSCQSGLMLFVNTDQQLSRQEPMAYCDYPDVSQSPTGAYDRMRTPSPEPSYQRSCPQGLPPPALHFAPAVVPAPAAVPDEVDFVAADTPLSRRDRRRGRFGRRTLGEDEWETVSQVSDFSIGSQTSSRGDSLMEGHRRTSGPVYVAEHLHWLESQDPRKVCRLKKIHKLGFDAASTLKAYFKRYGPVEQVLLSNMPVDKQGKCVTKPPRVPGVRVRPAGMGWVVMANVEDAEKLLSCDSHVVQGLPISVLRYTPKGREHAPALSIQEAVDEEAEADLEELLGPRCAVRQRWSDMA